MGKSEKAEKAVAVAGPGAVAVYEEKPAYLTGTARGSENVEMQDMIVPRIEICQPLSPCKDKLQPSKHIEGIQDGELFNTVTRQRYTDGVRFVPVWFRKQHLIFRFRKDGGGFRGAFNSVPEAEAARILLDDPEKHEIVEAAEHFVLVLNGDKLEQAIITCTKTKMKTSRTLNSYVQLRGEDRFSSVYALGTTQEKNDKGVYFNFSVKPLGYVDETTYKEGLALWQLVSSGERVLKTDTSDIEGEVATPSNPEM